jgi:aryl carrier-like protein
VTGGPAAGTRRRGAIERRPGSARSVPLSYWQEQMWLTDQLGDGAALSAPLMCARVTGPLDAAALRQALAAIQARHEVLRCTFDMADGEPVQTVHDAVELDHAVIDLPGADPELLTETCAREVRRGFDLRTGPAVRSRLYRLGREDHVLLVVRHHIIGDGRSDELFAAELAAHYTAIRHGTRPDLPPLPVQYPDVACWQRDRLSPEVTERLVARWASRLADTPPAVPLPQAGTRTPGRAGTGPSFSVPLPADLAAAALELASTERVSPFMLLLAVFRVALWKFTGQPGGLIATPAEDRSRPETQALIGCFLNTVLLAGDLSGDPTMSELFGRERAGALDAFAHQELPYPLLARSLRQLPPIQVTFAYQAGTQPVPALPGTAVTAIDLHRVPSIFDLMAKVERDDGGLRLQLASAPGVLPAEGLRQLAAHYLAILSRAVADPSTPVSRLVERPVPAGPAVPAAPAGPAVAPRVLLWSAGEAGRPPRGPAEELLAGIWAELLDAVPPGADVRILDCGGHSLTLARLAHRLREQFCVPVSVADLFERQTIAAQAELVETLLAEQLAGLPPDDVARLITEVTS